MDDRAAALLSKMAQWRLLVIFWHGGGRDLSSQLTQHLEYMIGLERPGACSPPARSASAAAATA